MKNKVIVSVWCRIVAIVVFVMGSHAGAEVSIFNIKYIEYRKSVSTTVQFIHRTEKGFSEREALYFKYELNQVGMPIVNGDNVLAKPLRFSKKELEKSFEECKKLFDEMILDDEEKYAPIVENVGKNPKRDVIIFQHMSNDRALFIYDVKSANFAKLKNYVDAAEKRLDGK